LTEGRRQDHWTFFSPAASIGPGERTGKFRLGGDQLITATDGKSTISYDDYAIALTRCRRPASLITIDSLHMTIASEDSRPRHRFILAE
jgi:hypothetical protein